MLQNVLFDLDGTLTDSKEGVMRCFQHAIEELGLLSVANPSLKV
jgi:phosphoglycolate phosphatase-like HAD superfamily hydrolase